MDRPEPPATGPRTYETASYSQLLADCLPEMKKFLGVLFVSIFQSWEGSFTLIAHDREGDRRVFEDTEAFAPLCHAINDLQLRDLCKECDKRWTAAVSRDRQPASYWCDWGLQDIAVPILVHGVSVGAILFG
jgi:hypothetical protein